MIITNLFAKWSKFIKKSRPVNKINQTALIFQTVKHYSKSIDDLCCLRAALSLAIRFSTEGFIKAVRFLNSLNTPERSYFFLKRFKALSMFSLP